MRALTTAGGMLVGGWLGWGVGMLLGARDWDAAFGYVVVGTVAGIVTGGIVGSVVPV